MDQDCIKKLIWTQGRGYGLMPRCTALETTAAVTYSRFRARFKCPVLHAQEIGEQKINTSEGVGTDVQETDKRLPVKTLVSPEVMTSVEKPCADHKSLLRINASAISKEEILEYINKETGRERLKEFFGKDNNGMRSPEMYVVIVGVLQAGLFGGAVAGFIGARVAKERYTKKHLAAQFETKFFGLRGYYDAILVGSVGFGAKWAARLGLFTGTFLMISQSVSIYRNKTSVLEYALGGALTGSLFRINMGLRGMFAAGVLGGSFGTLAGLIVLAVSLASGDSQENRHYDRIRERLLENREYEKFREARESIDYLPPTPS